MPCTDCTHIQVELGCLKEFMRGWFTVVNDKLSGLEDGQKFLISRFDKQDETSAKGDKDTVASHTDYLNIVQNGTSFAAIFPVESAVYEDENAITSIPTFNSAMKSEPIVASADVILNTELDQSQITTQDFTGYGKLGDFQISVSPVKHQPSLSVYSQYISAQNASIDERNRAIKTEPLLPQSQSADKQAYRPISSGQIGFQNNLSPHVSVSDVMDDSNVVPPYLNQSVMQAENFAVTDTRDIAAKQLQANAVESVLKTHRRISKRQGCTDREGKQSKRNDNASAINNFQEAHILCSCSNSNMCNLSSRIMASLGEKHFQCGYCKKEFSLKGNLVTHVRLHTGEKSHQCNYCEKKFSQNSHLVTHMRCHTGEKPYQCNYCEKRFSQKSPLVTHLRLHTGEKPYPCDYCEKRFSRKYHLVTHLRLHTGEKPYPCNYCEKRFSAKPLLLDHERWHMGEKPYQCGFCGKKFGDRRNCKAHERIHLNRR